MTERKFAVLINADPEHTGPAANGMEYALDFDESGYQAEIYFDGSATQWPGTLDDQPDHPVNEYYQEAKEKGLIGGACGYCANAYGAYDELEALDFDLLGGTENHGPHTGELIDDGYELITV
jgi:hypothetical protein